MTGSCTDPLGLDEPNHKRSAPLPRRAVGPQFSPQVRRGSRRTAPDGHKQIDVFSQEIASVFKTLAVADERLWTVIRRPPSPPNHVRNAFKTVPFWLGLRLPPIQQPILAFGPASG